MIKSSPVREKIILAAIDTIEKDGLQGVTIRTVAERAGVNSAAINYYFRSKQNLLDTVFKTTIEHSIGDLEAILDAGSKDARAMLEEFLIYLMDGAVLYPGLTKSHMYDVLVGRKADNLFLRRFNALLGKLAGRIKAFKPEESEEAVRIKVVQMMSAVILPALMPRAFRPLTGKTFDNMETRRSYVKTVVESFLK